MKIKAYSAFPFKGTVYVVTIIDEQTAQAVYKTISAAKKFANQFTTTELPMTIRVGHFIDDNTIETI